MFGTTVMAESNPEAANPEKLTYADVTRSSDDAVASAVVRDVHDLALDEPWWVPYGDDTAPCPVDYLVVAAAGCQVETFTQCLEKARVEEYEIRLHAERETAETDGVPEPLPAHTALRVSSLHFDITVETTPEFEGRVRRCLEVCEDACIVSRSLEDGIEVALSKSLEVTRPDSGGD